VRSDPFSSVESQQTLDGEYLEQALDGEQTADSEWKGPLITMIANRPSIAIRPLKVNGHVMMANWLFQVVVN
jgi:hypothetical protein